MKLAAFLLALSLASSAHGMDFYSVTPCRWFDTRVPGCVIGGGCDKGPLKSGEIRNMEVRQSVCPQGDPTWPRPIPVSAKVVVLHVAAVDATNPGRLVVFGGMIDPPEVALLNFRTGTIVGNVVFVQLGPDFVPGEPFWPDTSFHVVIPAGGSVHLVVDIVGYFE